MLELDDQIPKLYVRTLSGLISSTSNLSIYLLSFINTGYSIHHRRKMDQSQLIKVQTRQIYYKIN